MSISSISAGQTLENTSITLTDVQVLSGGLALSDTVGMAGELRIETGASASNVTDLNGFFDVIGGGVATGSTLDGDSMVATSGGTAIDTSVTGGSLAISNNGLALNTTVYGGGSDAGYLQVGSGGIAQNTTIEGGFDEVGGNEMSATLSTGSFLMVLSGGLVTSAFLAPNVETEVQSGGSISAISLATDDSIDFGGLTYASGGTTSLNIATDMLTITENGAVLTLQLMGNETKYGFALSTDNGATDFGKTVGTILTATTIKGADQVNLPSIPGATSGTNGSEININGSNSTVNGGPYATINGAGGNSNTFIAGSGPETLEGGSGDNLFNLGASMAFVNSEGTDTIIGGSGSATWNAAGDPLYFGGKENLIFTAYGKTASLFGGGTEVVNANSADILLFGGSGVTTFNGGSGGSTIVGGVAGTSITGGSGTMLAFASGAMTYSGGAGPATVIGGGGPLIANFGAGGGVAFGAPGGGNTLTAANGTAILVGGGDGDVLGASGTGNDTLVAGPGAETLNGAASTGKLVLFGGPGAGSLTGGAGNDLFVAGSGNETLSGGAGTNTYIFAASSGPARTDVITDFDPSRNAIGLFGYESEPGADAAALASQTNEGGSTVISLSDGTQIVFLGGPTLTATNFS